MGLIMIWISCSLLSIVKVEGVWCVARSEASEEALERGLEYVCSSGADCSPISSSDGLCFLPNTLQAHASYAFNSFFQRNNMALSSCSFASISTFAKTDPSYGSCVYPSSPSTAGGLLPPGGPPTGGTNPRTSPPLEVPPPSGITTVNGNGGLTPGTMGSGVPETLNSKATFKFSITTRLIILASFVLILSFIS